jgi:hypothetical protein
MYLVYLNEFDHLPTQLYCPLDLEMVLPYELPVGWYDDDWFRFHFDRNGIVVAFEVHEYCNRTQCIYRDGDCPWHPVGCGCSDDACQMKWIGVDSE